MTEEQYWNFMAVLERIATALEKNDHEPDPETTELIKRSVAAAEKSAAAQEQQAASYADDVSMKRHQMFGGSDDGRTGGPRE